ncbi:MAG: hypothetical protein ACYTEQ_20430 [Planctomycetota bacterium]
MAHGTNPPNVKRATVAIPMMGDYARFPHPRRTLLIERGDIYTTQFAHFWLFQFTRAH